MRREGQEEGKVAFGKRFVSGAAGAFLTSLIVLPFDVIKVKQQAQSQHLQVKVICPKHTDITTTKAGTKRGLNTVETFRKIIQTQGPRGLYVGLTPTLLMSLPNAAIYYSCYEELMDQLRSHNRKFATWNPLIAGAVARTIASTVTAPFEYIRTAQAAGVAIPAFTRTQHSRSCLRSNCAMSPRSAENSFALFVRRNLMGGASIGGNIGSLFRGLGATLWRDVPFSAIYWMSLENLREASRSSNSDTHYFPIRHWFPREGSIAREFVIGAVSGMIACFFTTPFDVIKTLQQSRKHSTNDRVSAFNFTACCEEAIVSAVPNSKPTNFLGGGTLAEIWHIGQTQGISTLWRGNTVRMIKVAPACAIMISSYEFGKRIL